MIEGIPLWVAATNAWIVAPDGPGGECVIVDAPPDPAAIVERIKHHGLKLVALLSTHGHLDHIGGMGTVSRSDGDIPVHIHDGDRHMILDPVGTSGGFAAMLDSSLDLRAPELLYGLDDGERVKGAGMEFTAIHTPGHTQGSVCFELKMEDHQPILFSGDHLFAGSIGRTDMPGGSFEQLMQSMAEKILPMADETAVLPGHGPTTTVGRERVTNPFILELLQGGF